LKPSDTPDFEVKDCVAAADDAEAVQELIHSGLQILSRMIARAVLKDWRAQADTLSTAQGAPIVQTQVMTFSTREEPKLVLSVPETAKLLGISRPTAYAAVRSGQIPSIRIGSRIIVPRAALMKLLERAANHGRP
jgi:excisionase family DNA binding protein